MQHLDEALDTILTHPAAQLEVAFQMLGKRRHQAQSLLGTVTDHMNTYRRLSALALSHDELVGLSHLVSAVRDHAALARANDLQDLCDDALFELAANLARC